jgi:uncharacterized protein
MANTIIQLKVLPEEFASEKILREKIGFFLKKDVSSIKGYTILRKSMDARSKIIWINLKVEVFLDNTTPEPDTPKFIFEPLKPTAKSVIIIGAGPAGIFAALQLLSLGIKPIILERGKDVRSRRRDLALLNKEGILNPESNYCFGEGGAGTYSDGKLYTRSNKRGNIQRILDLFVQFGADAAIQYEAHPHIGTNKLPQIITAMRNCIEACGGAFLFGKKLTDIIVENNQVKKIITADGDSFTANAYILATGHSARDIFVLLHKKNITIEAKPFALGVRVEHPQSIIDAAQYKCAVRNSFLPPASYSLVQQVNGKGVFSFCMCPGGIIATASTAPNELVVNGWSPSKRNNPYANSGMVVQVEIADIINNKKYGIKDSPLAMLEFQQKVEQDCYTAGGGNFVAPAQRLVDFCTHKESSSLVNCSYIPGIASANLNAILPKAISERLAIGFTEFGKKIKGYYTNEAVLVATESRTSSPVKIPRDATLLTHPMLHNLYPCGEGAGYAGGIVSAAMDGERCAVQISNILK